MPTPDYSHVAVLRLAHPDAPSLREVGRACGLSATWLSNFERGISAITEAQLALYARAIDRDPEEVRLRWIRQSLLYHETAARTMREKLKAAGKVRGYKGTHRAKRTA